MLDKIISYNKEHSEYGTEEFAHYMYGLVRMTKPNLFLELGTGHGSTAFMVAQAMKENGKGKVITLDNGGQHGGGYQQKILNKIKEFELENHIEFRFKEFNIDAIKDIQIVDIVFSDFNRHPMHINMLLSWIIKQIKNRTLLFIDGAATYYDSFNYLELMVAALSKNKIIKALSDVYKDDEDLIKKSMLYNFVLDHYYKDIDKPNQDSFSLLKIERKDIIL